MATYEIPLGPSPRKMSVVLNGLTYYLRFCYVNVADGGWYVDIADGNLNPLVCGVMLVTGADLLEQYAYLGIGGKLFVATDGAPGAVPTFENLGVDSHLYWEPN